MLLERIVQSARRRVAEQKRRRPLEAARALALKAEKKGDFPFEAALRREGLSFICEVKRASPSKGLIAEEYPYARIAAEYEAAGADAVSVLTEPDYFLGDISHLEEIRRTVRLPLLRKDFIVDEYQLYESKLAGADAVLLICSILDAQTLSGFLESCDELGLSALVEAHDEAEIHAALSAGARVIGINNRDLKTFKVDTGTFVRLARLVPQNALLVAESGISSPEDVSTLKSAGADAVLVGEALMRSADRASALERLRGGAARP